MCQDECTTVLSWALGLIQLSLMQVYDKWVQEAFCEWLVTVGLIKAYTSNIDDMRDHYS